MKRNLRARRNRGFTIVELIVVVTVIGLLAALAVGAYNTVVYQAKTAKSQALVNTLSTAKSLFVADPARVEADITAYNAGAVDAQFTAIAPYIRVNGNIPKTTADLLTFSGMPAGVVITLGTVDDPSAKPPVFDAPPAVAGYPQGHSGNKEERFSVGRNKLDLTGWHDRVDDPGVRLRSLRERLRLELEPIEK